MWTKRKMCSDQNRRKGMGEAKALNVSRLRRAPWKVTVPKRDCLKDISKVFRPRKEEQEAVDRRKCTPPLYKGYALYKIDGKKTRQHQNSTWCLFAAERLLRIPFITIQRYATYFFIVWFLSMYTFLFCLYACLWDSVLLFVYFRSVLLTFDWTFF